MQYEEVADKDDLMGVEDTAKKDILLKCVCVCVLNCHNKSLRKLQVKFILKLTVVTNKL